MFGSDLRTFKEAIVEFRRDFAWAPVDWIVMGLLVIAALGNWQKGRDLARACDLLIEAGAAFPVCDPQRDEITALCVAPPPAE